jgi:hypothetical protein
MTPSVISPSTHHDALRAGVLDAGVVGGVVELGAAGVVVGPLDVSPVDDVVVWAGVDGGV